MILLMVGFMMSAHAQYYNSGVAAGGYGGYPAPGSANGCHSIVNGKFEYVSGIPGCTEKRRSSSGDLVTFQTKSSMLNPASGKVVTEERTITQKLTKQDGKLMLTSFDGENQKGAVLTNTVVYNADASSQENAVTQQLVTQRADGKEQKFLIYDRNLCARFRDAGDIQRDMQMLQACSSILPKFEDAAREWNAKLKKDNTSLGVASAFTKKGVLYRPAAAGSIRDLIAVASACVPLSLNMDFNFGTDDKSRGGVDNDAPKPCADCRPASATGVSH